MPTHLPPDLPKKGDKVVVTKTTGPQRGKQLFGLTRYVGITKFDVGIWIGVELGEPIGKNDGSVKGVRYFSCKDLHGLFVRPEFVTKMSDTVNPIGRNREVNDDKARRRSSSRGRKSPRGSLTGRKSPRGSLTGSKIPRSPSNSNRKSPKSPKSPRFSYSGTSTRTLNKLSVTDMSTLRTLLQHSPDEILEVDENGNSRLHHIAQRGSRASVDALKYLLKHALEMYLHRRNKVGMTCVMMAAVARNWKSVEFLISVGADAIDKGPEGGLACVWELARENSSTQKAVRSGMEKWEITQRQAKEKDLFITPGIIHNPRILNTLLHAACEARDYVCVRTILRCGGNVNALDDDGNTPLHNCALSNDYVEMAKLLISSGGKINARNADGYTPVLVAARTRHCWKMVQCFVNYGANVTEKDQDRMNVFEYAQLHEVSKKILERAMDQCRVNAKKGLLELVDTSELVPEDQRNHGDLRRKDSARRVRFNAEDMMEDDDEKDDIEFGLEEVLSIPLCRRIFHRYMQEAYCEENINFLEAVESYQNLFPERSSDSPDIEIVRAAALSINEEFIVTSGVQMVNIPEELRDDIDERIEDGDFARDLFDEAGREVFEMVDTEVFPRFQQGEMYNDMMNDPDIKEAVDEIQQIKASVIEEYERSIEQQEQEEKPPRRKSSKSPKKGKKKKMKSPKSKKKSKSSMFKSDIKSTKVVSSNMNLSVNDHMTLQDLMSNGSDLMEVDEYGNTRLHCIASLPTSSANIRALSFLFENTKLRDCINNVNNDDLTPGMIAGREKSWDMVTYFTSQGADIVFKGLSNKMKSIWELCRNTREGLSGLHRGVESQQKSILDGRMEKSVVTTNKTEIEKIFFKVCVAGDFIMVRHVVEAHRVDVNTIDKDGNTVLHILCKSQDNLRIIKYIISMHAEVSLKNNANDTPCLIAARLRNWDVMQYLIRSGASIKEADNDGETVKSYAQWNAVSQQALKDGQSQYKDFKSWQSDANGDDIDDDIEESEISQVDREQALQEQLMVLEKTKQQEMAKVTRRHEDDIVDMVIKMTTPKDDENEPPPTPEVKQENYGTYQGLCTGKKTDKRKQKACTVFVGDQAVEIHYKKGPWYKRSVLHEIYNWHKQMVVTKADSSTLLIVLDPKEKVRLKLTGVHADSLEEYMIKRISLAAINVA